MALGIIAFASYSFFANSDIRATPTSAPTGLTEAQRKAADDSIAELRKMAAATEVGISKRDYSAMLIPTKASAQKAVSDLPDGELRKSIAGTIEAYQDAHVLWDVMKDDTYFTACPTQPDTRGMSEPNRILTQLRCDPVGGPIVQKYNIPLRDMRTKAPVNPKDVDDEKVIGVVFKTEGLSVIWSVARKQLENAGELSKK